jgi:hypothetical protein
MDAAESALSADCGSIRALVRRMSVHDETGKVAVVSAPAETVDAVLALVGWLSAAKPIIRQKPRRL